MVADDVPWPGDREHGEDLAFVRDGFGVVALAGRHSPLTWWEGGEDRVPRWGGGGTDPMPGRGAGATTASV